MTTARQRTQLLVREVRHHFAQTRIWAEEIFANVVSVFNDVALEFAVDGCVHFVQQHAVVVVCKQIVPLGTPHNFDDVPSGTTECGFKFLNDFSVAAHWAIEALQVAVDNKCEVV